VITVKCHEHCSASAVFANEGEAVSREWKHVTAGTETTGIEEVWFCPKAPTAYLSRFLERKLQHGGAKARTTIMESRIRE
jgi:hypothetical protein